MSGVESGYTKGAYNSTGVHSTDFEQWVSTPLHTSTVVDCGPDINGYHHVTRIEQNHTIPYSDTYLFGPDQGMTSSGDLLQELHGNVTLNTGHHDVLLEGTGLIKEEVDLRETITNATEVTVVVEMSHGSLFGYLRLEAPDGQQMDLCTFTCGSTSDYDVVWSPTSKIGTYTVVFDSTALAGDWKLYGRDYNHPSGLAIHGWTLKFDPATVAESVISPSYRLTDTYRYTLGDTITFHGPPPRYAGDLYLMAVGVEPTETVLVRATDYVSPSLLSITNLPSYVPYEITHGDYILKDGMTDTSGRIDIEYEDVGIELTEPIVFKYWPNSLTYIGNHHANGKSILFDTYHDRVIPFPWDPDDPLLYVAKAYIRMTVPVDDMSFDAIRLYNKAGQHISYSYLTGTYNAGDEIYVPIFLGANEIHLKINGDWVQSYVKDVQQNTQARVFGGTGSIEGVELSETATIFATKPGEVVALVSVTVTGSSNAYFSVDYSGYNGNPGRYASPIEHSGWYQYGRSGESSAQSACNSWDSYMENTIATRTRMHETVAAAFNEATSGGVVAVSVYRNGIPVGNASNTVGDTDRSFDTSHYCGVRGPRIQSQAESIRFLVIIHGASSTAKT